MKATGKTLATLFATTMLLGVVGCTSNAQPPVETTAATTGNIEIGSLDAGYTGPALAGLTSEDFDVQVISDELNYPWEVQLAENGFVLTEIAGNIVMIGGDGLERYPLQTSSPVVHDGGSGLLGIALAKDFESTGIGYVYYSYSAAAGLANRIAQVTFDGGAWTETAVLVDDIPGHQLYNGGRLAFGPDGYLYATTGWIHDPEMARDINSLGGKILRMDTDGNPVAGNAVEGSLVYSLGHRNPQSLDWNADGVLFAAEHGESGNDEINIIEPGGDYGWPTIQGDASRSGLVSPYLNSGSQTWAPSGAAFAGDELTVAALRGTGLYVLNEESRELEMVFTSDERVRTVLPHGDSIYIATTNASPRTGGNEPDRLLRLTPKP